MIKHALARQHLPASLQFAVCQTKSAVNMVCPRPLRAGRDFPHQGHGYKGVFNHELTEQDLSSQPSPVFDTRMPHKTITVIVTS